MLALCRTALAAEFFGAMTAAILCIREAEAIAILRNLLMEQARGQEGDRDYDVFCARSSSALFSRQFHLGQQIHCE